MPIVQQVRTRKSLAASGFLVLAASCPAGAASTEWHMEEGANIRLLTAGAPDGSGRLRGAIEIALKPGWKTYWRDPGTAGVPPSLDVSGSANVASATLGFPAPERHDDGYGAWAGYAAPVSLPVTFALADPGGLARIEAKLFLGLCREICVPVSAHLALDTGADGRPEDAAAVEAAFATLPAPATKGFGVQAESLKKGELLLSARLPDGIDAPPQLFLAGESGFVFGVPSPEKTQEGWRFAVPLLDRPSGPDQPPVFYTLTAGGAAVSGTFALP